MNTPRRRRPSQWDAREPLYGIPMPAPGALAPPSVPPIAQHASARPNGDTPSRPHPAQSPSGRLPAGSKSAPPYGHGRREVPGYPRPIVGPPAAGEIGPLAGIDIQALRALIAPANASLAGESPSHPGSVASSGPRQSAGGGLSNSGEPRGDPPSPAGQHATRHARRLYVGNLPLATTDVEVGDFFNRALIKAKGVESEGSPVVSVYLNLEKRFAFIELRTLKEAAAALAMDGVLFRSMSLRMRRPSDYNAAVCPPEKPPHGFDPSLLGIVSTQVGDGPNKVFIGGIPYSLNEDAIKDYLQGYGRLAAFNLIKDPATGLSKGFAFFEYADPSIVDKACAGLNGTTIGDKMLTVRRATQHAPNSVSRPSVSGLGGQVEAIGMHGDALVRQSTRVVQLRNVVTEEELADDNEYAEIVEETEVEARRFGALEKILVPRPAKDSDTVVKGVGRVFLVFEKVADAERAFAAMDGRKFDERTVQASYVSDEKFQAGDY